MTLFRERRNHLKAKCRLKDNAFNKLIFGYLLGQLKRQSSDLPHDRVSPQPVCSHCRAAVSSAFSTQFRPLQLLSKPKAYSFITADVWRIMCTEVRWLNPKKIWKETPDEWMRFKRNLLSKPLRKSTKHAQTRLLINFYVLSVSKNIYTLWLINKYLADSYVLTAWGVNKESQDYYGNLCYPQTRMFATILATPSGAFK